MIGWGSTLGVVWDAPDETEWNSLVGWRIYKKMGDDFVLSLEIPKVLPWPKEHVAYVPAEEDSTYVVTAVNMLGIESFYSDEITVAKADARLDIIMQGGPLYPFSILRSVYIYSDKPREFFRVKDYSYSLVAVSLDIEISDDLVNWEYDGSIVVGFGDIQSVKTKLVNIP